MSDINDQLANLRRKIFTNVEPKETRFTLTEEPFSEMKSRAQHALAGLTEDGVPPEVWQRILRRLIEDCDDWSAAS